VTEAVSGPGKDPACLRFAAQCRSVCKRSPAALLECGFPHQAPRKFPRCCRPAFPRPLRGPVACRVFSKVGNQKGADSGKRFLTPGKMIGFARFRAEHASFTVPKEQPWPDEQQTVSRYPGVRKNAVSSRIGRRQGVNVKGISAVSPARRSKG
jgi:hypothetical protein